MDISWDAFTELIFPSIGVSFLLPFLLFPILRKGVPRALIAIFLPALLFQVDMVFAPGRPLLYEIAGLFAFILAFNLIPVIFAEGILSFIRIEYRRRAKKE